MSNAQLKPYKTSAITFVKMKVSSTQILYNCFIFAVKILYLGLLGQGEWRREGVKSASFFFILFYIVKELEEIVNLINYLIHFAPMLSLCLLFAFMVNVSSDDLMVPIQ